MEIESLRILLVQCLFIGFLSGWTVAIAILGFEDIYKRNKKGE